MSEINNTKKNNFKFLSLAPWLQLWYLKKLLNKWLCRRLSVSLVNEMFGKSAFMTVNGSRENDNFMSDVRAVELRCLTFPTRT